MSLRLKVMAARTIVKDVQITYARGDERHKNKVCPDLALTPGKRAFCPRAVMWV